MVFVSEKMKKSCYAVRTHITRDIMELTDDELLKRMRSSKASYAGFLADVISRNPNKKTGAQIIPQAVIGAFNQLEGRK